MSTLKTNILIGLATGLLLAIIAGIYFSLDRYRHLESSLSGLENSNKQLSLEKERLENKLASRDVDVSDLTRKSQSKDQDLSKLTTAKKEMESTLRSQLAVLNDQVSTLQSQSAAYEKEREALVASRQWREKQISELQERLDKKETELGTSQKLYDKAVEDKHLIDTELSDRMGELTLLREQFKNLESKQEAEVQFYTKTLNEYKKRLIDQDQQISDSAEYIEALKTKELSLMNKLAAAEEASKEFESQQADTDEKIAEFKNEIQRRDTQLNEANVYVTQLIDSQKGLENQILQTRSAMQKEEAEKSEVWGRLLELQTNMKDRNQNLEQLRTRLSKTEKEKRESEESFKRMKETYNDLVGQFQTEIASKEATIQELTEKLSITFVQDILFRLGQTSISANGRQTLEKIGTILKRNTTDKIVVMGHSDNLPIAREYQERYPTNWELSSARAAAVVRYFQHTVGIDPRQMEAVGHSFYKPIADNDSPENRAKNRRVEIFIMPAK